MANDTWVEKARKKFQKKRYGEDETTSQDMPMSPEDKKKMSDAYDEAQRKHEMEDMEAQATQDLRMKRLEKKLKGAKF